MKYVSVRDLRSKSAEVWKGLPAAGEMVLTSNGRPIAILSAVSEETLEETLAALRRAKAVVAVSEMQRRSTELGTDAIGPEEIDAEIKAVRRARRRRADLAEGAVADALAHEPEAVAESGRSRWALLVERIEKDAQSLGEYRESFDRDRKEFRES